MGEMCERIYKMCVNENLKNNNGFVSNYLWCVHLTLAFGHDFGWDFFLLGLRYSFIVFGLYDG